MTLTADEQARIARECVEAQLPRLWSPPRRARLMREVDLYAQTYAQAALERIEATPVVTEAESEPEEPVGGVARPSGWK